MNEAIQNLRGTEAEAVDATIDDARFKTVEGWTWLEGRQPYVVCAFFTPAYRAVAQKLQKSLQKLGISHHFAEAEQQSTWEAGTRLKPHFVWKCLKAFPQKDVLYLDSDAVVQRQPEFFDDINTDVAILFTPAYYRGRYVLKISAGTLYISNTPGGRQFAKNWCAQDHKSNPLTKDEDMIYMAFEAFEGITFKAMPLSYSKVFDSPGPSPVIEHFQASRKQFRLGRVLRKTRQAGVAIAIAALIAGLVWYFFG